MAYRASLEIEGNKYKVRKCSYAIEQNTDENGRPSSMVFAGKVNLEIEASDCSLFIGWALAQVEKKDGKIKWDNTNVPGILKSLEFKDAFLVYFEENMDAFAATPMTANLIISAKKITYAGGNNHENSWQSKWIDS